MTCELTAIALLSCLAPQDTLPPEHLLRLSPVSGKQYLHVEQEMSYEASQPDRDAVQRIRLELFWEIEGASTEDGRYRGRDRLYRVRVADTGAGSGRRTVSQTDDSAMPTTPPGPLRWYRSLLEGHANWERDELGVVTERALPETWRTLDDRLGSVDLRPSMLLRPAELQLPEHPVAVGARWRTEPASLPRGGNASQAESEFTLISVSNGRASIRERFALRPPVVDDGLPLDEDAGTRALRTYTLDLSTGQVVATEVESTIRTTLRGRPIHLRLRRTSQLADEPALGALEPLEPASLSRPWAKAGPSDPREPRDEDQAVRRSTSEGGPARQP